MKTFNTDDIDKLKFRPHGRIEWSTLEEGIVVYKAYGPFNKELFEALTVLEAEGFLASKNEWDKWAEVVLFVDSCMPLQEAIDVYREFLKESADIGVAPAVSAFIYEPGIEGGFIAKGIYKDVYDYAGVPQQSFTNFDDALNWARERLAEINKA